MSTEDAGTVRANGKPSPSRHVTADLLSIAERKRMRTAVKRMAGERGEDVSIAAAAPVRHDPGARVSDVLSGSMQVAELVDWLEGQCDRVSMEKAGRAILIRCFKSTLEKNWPGRVKAEAERRFPEACSVALVTPEVKMSVGGGR